MGDWNVPEYPRVTGDITEEVVRIAKQYAATGLILEHPQLIEGSFYVTQKQYKAILEYGRNQPIVYEEPGTRSIPVVVVGDYRVMKLPSGKLLINATVLRSFYIFDPSIAEDAGIKVSQIRSLESE